MKNTKKATAEYCVSKRFVAISFNPDGSRGTNYSGCSPLAALNFFSLEAKKGNRAALFPEGFNYRQALGYSASYTPGISNDNSQTDPNFYANVIKFAISSEMFF